MANFILKSIDAKVVSLDFPITAALSSTEILVPFTGVSINDFVVLDAKFPINTSFIAWVSADNSVTVRFTNFTGNTMNLSKFDVRLLVLKQAPDTGIVPIPAPTATAVKTVPGNKTLDLTDADKLLDVTGLSTITVPLNSAVAFPLGTMIYINQSGIADVSIAPQVGVILQSTQNYRKLFGQFSQAYLINLSTNTWQLSGRLKN